MEIKKAYVIIPNGAGEVERIESLLPGEEVDPEAILAWRRVHGEHALYEDLPLEQREVAKAISLQ